MLVYRQVRQPVVAPAPAFDAVGFLAFARVCGGYLRDGKLNHVLALSPPTVQVGEYRDSLLCFELTTFSPSTARKSAHLPSEVWRSYAPLGSVCDPALPKSSTRPLVRKGAGHCLTLGSPTSAVTSPANPCRPGSYGTHLGAHNLVHRVHWRCTCLGALGLRGSWFAAPLAAPERRDYRAPLAHLNHFTR